MKIESSTVHKLLITEVDRLDPVTVILEDIAPRQGKIIIECYGQSWSAYWGGMGNNTIAQFFSSCDNGYLSGNLGGPKSHVDDFEGLVDHARKEILRCRKSQEIEEEEARELFDSCERLQGVESFDGAASTMQPIFGDEWWYSVPTVPNPDYEYLCRIIDAVREALLTLNTSEGDETK